MAGRWCAGKSDPSSIMNELQTLEGQKCCVWKKTCDKGADVDIYMVIVWVGIRLFMILHGGLKKKQQPELTVSSFPKTVVFF